MIMAARSTRKRDGYTLLEVIVASLIALFVLIALYSFMEVSLRSASEGREAVERANLASGIIHRIRNDLAPSITPPSAKPKQQASNSPNQGAQNTNAANATNTNTSNATTTTDSTTTDSSATDTGTTTATAISLQAGVIGDADVLTIYTTRLPDPRNNGSADGDTPVPSDIRRIVYWIGQSGGLCRQEIPWVTGEQVYNVVGPVSENDKSEKDYLIAPEVVALGLKYYDINSSTDESGWTSSWDGRELGPDNLTPKGPPTAIRVSFTIKYKNQRGEETTKDYRQVIPIITASGPNSTDQLQSPAASDSTNSGSNQTGQ